MERNADATRRRILDAAVEEFSTHGIAGARVDRIAAASGSNKSMIYTYYGSKDGLFDAVFDAVVVATVDEVPMDAGDLPEYAARLFDQHLRRPAPLRIGTWDALERASAGARAASVVAATREKVHAIAGAQREGRVSDRFDPETLLALVLALSLVGVSDQPRPRGRAAAARRAAIEEAVAALVAP